MPLALRYGDLHFGGLEVEVGGVFGQACGLGLHQLHGGGLLSPLIGLESKAPYGESRGRSQKFHN